MDTIPSPPDAALAAIRASGGAEALAAKLSVARSTVYYWRANGFPLDRVAEIERATGIPRHALRPDSWPAPVVTA